jgi:TonB family protein
MKKYILINILLFLVIVSYCQTQIDTLYLNDSHIKVPKADATIIAHHVQKDSFLTVTEFNKSMQIKSKIDYRVRNKGKKNEYIVYYGSYENYHDNGQLKTKAYVINGKWHGSLVSYYDNGKTIRIETYEYDSLKTSQCMNREGKEIAYFPYQVEPVYPNGSKAMFEFLGQNIVYPRKAREDGVEGTVYIGFVIDTDGSLIDIAVTRGVSKELDDEGVRVVKSMPKWSVGQIDGELVKVAYTLPIKFKLENGTDGLLDRFFKKKKKNRDGDE